jgi:hypothetical protein
MDNSYNDSDSSNNTNIDITKLFCSNNDNDDSDNTSTNFNLNFITENIYYNNLSNILLDKDKEYEIIQKEVLFDKKITYFTLFESPCDTNNKCYKILRGKYDNKYYYIYMKTVFHSNNRNDEIYIYYTDDPTLMNKYISNNDDCFELKNKLQKIKI